MLSANRQPRNDARSTIARLLERIWTADPATYQHSVDVGILAGRIACFFGFDPGPITLAGFGHDAGKLAVRPELLQKTTGWTKDDSKEMEHHTIAGYEILNDLGLSQFARIAAMHHLFQPKPYPQTLPWKEKPDKAELMVARIIGVADRYSALHRSNDRFGSVPLSEGQIMGKMFEMTNDAVSILMVWALYLYGIL